jgi:hypothetical protein
VHGARAHGARAHGARGACAGCLGSGHEARVVRRLDEREGAVLPSTSVEVGVHRLADGHRERGDSMPVRLAA